MIIHPSEQKWNGILSVGRHNDLRHAVNNVTIQSMKTSDTDRNTNIFIAVVFVSCLAAAYSISVPISEYVISVINGSAR